MGNCLAPKNQNTSSVEQPLRKRDTAESQFIQSATVPAAKPEDHLDHQAVQSSSQQQQQQTNADDLDAAVFAATKQTLQQGSAALTN